MKTRIVPSEEITPENGLRAEDYIAMPVQADRVALIDLDGTVADYDGAMQEALKKIAAPTELNFSFSPDEPSYMDARRYLIKKQPGFWKGLARISKGFEIVQALREQGFMLHVLTKGPKVTTSAWTEKAEWCGLHLPDAFITVTQDKSLVYGRILVDDWPPYFMKWLQVRPRGQVIMVAQPWNEGIEHPQVFRYDGNNYAELVAVIKTAYERQSYKEG